MIVLGPCEYILRSAPNFRYSLRKSTLTFRQGSQRTAASCSPNERQFVAAAAPSAPAVVIEEIAGSITRG
jgi:hypothetical protein